MPQPNYLLGRGENLAGEFHIASDGSSRPMPYSFADAQSRLTAQVSEMAEELRSMPETSFVDGEAVAAVTINPQQISKSSFPARFLVATGLQAVGSHSVLHIKSRDTRDYYQRVAREPLCCRRPL